MFAQTWRFEGEWEVIADQYFFLVLFLVVVGAGDEIIL